MFHRCSARPYNMSVFALQVQKPVRVVSLPPDISPGRFSSPVFVRPTNPVNHTMTSVQPRVVSMSGAATALQSTRQTGNFMAPPRVTTLPNAPVNVQKRTPAIIRAPCGMVAHRVNAAQPVSAPKIVRLSRPASASNAMSLGGASRAAPCSSNRRQASNARSARISSERNARCQPQQHFLPLQYRCLVFFVPDRCLMHRKLRILI